MKAVAFFYRSGCAPRGRLKRSALLSLLLSAVGALYLIPVASAAGVSGRVIGWPPQGAGGPAVVWLESVRVRSAPNAYLVMAQHDGRFVPAFLVAAVGQIVEMPNLDEVAHNVFSATPLHEFNLGLYAMGERKEVTFDRPGLVEVACSIHRFMRARILVVPSALYATVSPDGSYAIPNVPAGNYTLRFWADGKTAFSLEIAVPPAGRTHLDFAAGEADR
jgi:plastocyanin